MNPPAIFVAGPLIGFSLILISAASLVAAGAIAVLLLGLASAQEAPASYEDMRAAEAEHARDDGAEQRRSVIQVVELHESGGVLSCERNQPTRMGLTAP